MQINKQMSETLGRTSFSVKLSEKQFNKKAYLQATVNVNLFTFILYFSRHCHKALEKSGCRFRSPLNKQDA